MNYAIVEDNVIKNVIVADESIAMPGTFPLPDGKWIGDRYDDTPTPQEDTDALTVDHEYRLTLLELGVTKEA